MKKSYFTFFWLINVSVLALPFLVSYRYTTPPVTQASPRHLQSLNQQFEKMPTDIVNYAVEGLIPDEVTGRSYYKVYSTLSTLRVGTINPQETILTSNNAAGLKIYDFSGMTNGAAGLAPLTDRGDRFVTLLLSNSLNLTYIYHQESTNFPPYTRFWFVANGRVTREFYEDEGVCTNCTSEQILNALKSDINFIVDRDAFPFRLSPEEISKIPTGRGF
jgi:hypothetical protein